MNSDFRFYSRWAMHNEISMNEGDAYSKERMQQELELQLHQQYAENNNANLGSVVTLIVALLAVFAGYGYVYLHSSFEFSKDFMELCKDDVYTLDAVLLTATAAYVVLGIMYYICVSQGMKQRMEQFVTFAIRAKYYAKNVADKPIDRKKVSGLSPECKLPESLMSDSYLRVFPPEYHPFKERKEENEKDNEKDNEKEKEKDKDKKEEAIIERRIWKLTQGLFGDLLPVVMFAGGLLTVSWTLKVGCNIFHNHTNDSSCIGVLCFCIMAIIFIIVSLLLYCKIQKLLEKYNARHNYYKDVINQSYNSEG